MSKSGVKYAKAYNNEFVIEDYELYGEFFEDNSKQWKSVEEVVIELTFEFIDDLKELTVEMKIENVRILWSGYEGDTHSYLIANDGTNFDKIDKFPVNDTVRLDKYFHFVIDTDNDTVTIINNN